MYFARFQGLFSRGKIRFGCNFGYFQSFYGWRFCDFADIILAKQLPSK